MIKYTKTKDDTKVTFENGKVLLFPSHWDIKAVKYLAKHSRTFQYLFNRTANLGAINNTVIPSTEEPDTRRHFFYLAVKNTMSCMTRHGYSLDDLVKMESVIMAEVLDKSAIMEYALEKDTRLELADVVRLHSYR